MSEMGHGPPHRGTVTPKGGNHPEPRGECARCLRRSLSRGRATMTKHVLGGLIATTILWPILGTAQTTIIETTGAAPPDEVVTYVQRERVPSVRVEGDISVGFTLPPIVELRTIP